MIAIAAGALAVVVLVVCALLARRLRRIRSTQQLIAGEDGERTLAEHAGQLDQRLAELGRQVEDSVGRLEGRGAITTFA